MPPRSPLARIELIPPSAVALAALSGALTLILCIAGCDRSASSRDAARNARNATASPVRAKPPTAADLSPKQVVQQLHAHRSQGRYRQMCTLLVEERRRPVEALVLAVDELVAAESGLQEAIRRAIGEGSATHFAQRQQVANIIGVLSRDVRVVREQIAGDEAEVTIQVAGRVPLEVVRLERRDGVWQVQTDEPISGLAETLRDLAAVTRRMAGEVERRAFTAEEINHELALRQAPVLRRIAELVDEAENE